MGGRGLAILLGLERIQGTKPVCRKSLPSTGGSDGPGCVPWTREDLNFLSYSIARVNKGRGNEKGMGMGCTAIEAQGLPNRGASRSLDAGNHLPPLGDQAPTMSVSARDLGHAGGGSLKGARGTNDSRTAEERLWPL